ncbi:MAG TPA: protein-L-isoaspartate(D-aspartate) O-methyltransferase [Candidatus Binatia bacterium]|nr:protein-L-isoaspartate(D-aspartate) O-methyltransferase [Candidatus Binatia bacterium]
MSEIRIPRQQMVDSQLRARGVSDPLVLEAMLHVPRDQFVPEAYRSESYEDHPLPIGEGQTISQPYIVASMLESVRLKSSDKVLEVGTGSGYVNALLAEIVAQVFSVERHALLAERARSRLARLGYTNVRVFTGDGSLGLPDLAPFDAILVSAAAPVLPELLVSQLAEGGHMIVPIGSADAQQLQLVRKINGRPQVTMREMVRFVPLIAGPG